MTANEKTAFNIINFIAGMLVLAMGVLLIAHGNLAEGILCCILLTLFTYK